MRRCPYCGALIEDCRCSQALTLVHLRPLKGTTMSKQNVGLGDVILSGSQFRTMNDEIEKLRTGLNEIAAGRSSDPQTTALKALGRMGTSETRTPKETKECGACDGSGCVHCDNGQQNQRQK